MKAVKILGIVLILLGAVLLVISYFQGWVNDNVITSCSLLAMIIGLIAYIFGGKKALGELSK